jgi:RNA polymerase sigma-70 factor (ECF subfamily)
MIPLASFPPQNDPALSDQTLIAFARVGDRRGFSMLFVRYRERLFHAMLGLVGSRAAADDLVQAAFLRAFTKIDTFREDAQFYTWLFRIAINLRRSYFRHSAREMYMAELGSWYDHPCAVLPPDKKMEDDESIQLVRVALNRIEAHHRSILVLREYERLSYREIGNRLGVGTGTVRSRLSRARARFRTEIEHITDKRLLE